MGERTTRPWLSPEDRDDASARLVAALVFLRSRPPDVRNAIALIEQAVARLDLEAVMS